MKHGVLPSTSDDTSCSSTPKLHKSGSFQRHKAVRSYACKYAITMLRGSGKVGAVNTWHDIVRMSA
ncbi:hypothetical protein FIBSPDRAFT_868140, partial [Athelia psychrophila]